jgi:hypothetical protein
MGYSPNCLKIFSRKGCKKSQKVFSKSGFSVLDFKKSLKEVKVVLDTERMFVYY